MSRTDLPLVVLVTSGIAILAVHLRQLIRRRELGDPLASAGPRPVPVTAAHILLVFLLYASIQYMGLAALGVLPDHAGPASAPTRSAGSSHAVSSPETGLIRIRTKAQTSLADLLAKVVTVAVIVYLLSRISRTGLAGVGLRIHRFWHQAGIGLAGYLAAVPLVYGLLSLILLMLRGTQLPKHEVLECLAEPRLGSAWKVGLVVNAVAAAPLGEELFFRGMIQNAVRSAGAGPYAAVLLAALLFGLAHVAVPHTILPLAVFGVILGYLYERTGSLIAPLIAHVVFNGATIVAVLWWPESFR